MGGCVGGVGAWPPPPPPPPAPVPSLAHTPSTHPLSCTPCAAMRHAGVLFTVSCVLFLVVMVAMALMVFSAVNEHSSQNAKRRWGVVFRAWGGGGGGGGSRGWGPGLAVGGRGRVWPAGLVTQARRAWAWRPKPWTP